VGRGCGGRGIIHGFELLEKLGFHDWGFDYVLLDFWATWSAAASACRLRATCARR
jgi:nitrogenase subunit NifH